MEKIKIGLFGFGRTGKIVAKEILKDTDLDLIWVVRKTDQTRKEYASILLGKKYKKGKIFSINQINDSFFKTNKVDVIIDFSDTKGVNFYESAVNEKIKIISAVSNYDTEDLKKLILLSKKTSIVHSPNITVGINFIMVTSKILQNLIPNADIQIVEEHFRDKKDISGTAIKIAGLLGLDIEKHISSIRAGGIVSNHNLIFGLPDQTIRLTHESINRAAFGQGAIFATKWVMDKSRGIYSMEDIILEVFKKNINNISS